MKNRKALGFALLAAACAASAIAAPPARDGVKDPETGITLHPPKHDTQAPPGSKQEKFAAEVKAAMQRVATVTKKAVRKADVAFRDATRNDKT